MNTKPLDTAADPADVLTTVFGKRADGAEREFNAAVIGPYVDLREFGSVEVSDHTSLIQTALDQAPIYSTVVFPTKAYTVTGSGKAMLTMNRVVNLELNGSPINATASGADTNIIYMHPFDVGAGQGVGDARGMFIRNGAIRFLTATGKHAIVISGTPDPDDIANSDTPIKMFNPLVYNCRPASANDSHAAIFIGGDVHSSRIFDCPGINNGIEYGSFLGGERATDAHRVRGNLIFGNRVGIKMHLIFGTLSHEIAKNVIVNRDGAIDIVYATQVKIRDNHIEQSGGVNQGAYQSSIVIGSGTADDLPAGWPNGHTKSEMVEVTGNNFGGGANVQTNITLINSLKTIIDRNDFYAPASIDVNITPNAEETVMGRHNFARGPSRSTFPPTSISVSNNGARTLGSYKAISTMGLANSWSATGRVQSTDDGHTLFSGKLTGGTTAATTLLFTLPAEFRPQSDRKFVVATDTANGNITVSASNGQVRIGDCPGTEIHLDGLRFVSAGLW